MSPRRWPFAARLLSVSAMLLLLLGAAVTLLIIGRPVPVRVAGARTRTISRTVPASGAAARPRAGGSANAIVPAGLPTGPPTHRHGGPTRTQHLGHARSIAAESRTRLQLFDTARLARGAHARALRHRAHSTPAHSAS